jgi:hypothetical protein
MGSGRPIVGKGILPKYTSSIFLLRSVPHSLDPPSFRSAFLFLSFLFLLEFKSLRSGVIICYLFFSLLVISTNEEPKLLLIPAPVAISYAVCK